MREKNAEKCLLLFFTVHTINYSLQFLLVFFVFIPENGQGETSLVSLAFTIILNEKWNCSVDSNLEGETGELHGASA